MLILGAVFNCLDPLLTIAAMLAHRSPFVMPVEKKFEADRAKMRLARQTGRCAALHVLYCTV